jgi:transposase
MYVRQKKNKSGVVSVQVIDKSSGRYRVAKTIGSSSDATIIKRLVAEAELYRTRQLGLLEIDFEHTDTLFESFIAGITRIRIIGIEFLLGKIFDTIGFDKIKDELFRKLVLARLCYPVSKLKTTEYLRRYEGYDTDEDKIYRYLDKLYSTQKRTVQQISYQHTLQVLNNAVSIVFYDVTTLYFEIKQEDELRKTGFSKDGKHQNPQIVLGLLVSTDGYPLAYEIYKGNKFEGDTMLPVLNAFKRKYKLKKLVVVADAGLLSNRNIESLISNKYEYILGARIKTESHALKTRIQALELKNGETAFIQKDSNNKLIISYSQARADKDNANRERGINKLKKLIKSKKLTKAQINNKGYNKFLKMTGEMAVKIDEDKINQDKQWDGLKGYITNTTLSNDEVIENYNHLWQIEKAFRVAKTDIKIRPVYHQLPKRIEAHICISFVAYKVFKELERQLKQLQADLSPEKAIDIAKTIYSIKGTKPKSKITFEKTLLLTEEQKLLAKLFNF